MDATFTPGPWGFHSFPAYGYGITAADSPQARESFACVHFADIGRGRTSERAKADARLIASAPELLAALLQVQRMGYCDVGDRMMVDAAIAKATGAA